MANIEYIHNVVSAVSIQAVAPIWETSLVGMPGDPPDECIIRSVSFNGSAVDGNAYMIWCSLKSSFIASFCGGSISTYSPNTIIRLNGVPPSVLQFQLYSPSNIGSPPIAVNSLVGEVIIHMDFIRYRRA